MFSPFNSSPKVSHFRFFPASSRLLTTISKYIYKVTSPFDAVVNRGNLCVKGRFGYDFIYNKDRVTTPLIRKKLRRPARAPRPSTAISGARSPGTRPSITPPTGCARSTSVTGPTPWPCIAAPRQPTRTTIYYRNFSARCFVATTSITAPVCATRGPWSRCRWRWAPRR